MVESVVGVVVIEVVGAYGIASCAGVEVVLIVVRVSIAGMLLLLVADVRLGLGSGVV